MNLNINDKNLRLREGVRVQQKEAWSWGRLGMASRGWERKRKCEGV